MSDAATVDGGHSNVVDQLFGDDGLGVPYRIENFAERERRGGVLANDTKTFLEFRRDGIFEPEEMIGFEAFAEASRFDRRETVMGVVQEMNVIAKFHAQGFEELWDMQQVFFRRPEIFAG
jgi:hypothetical protein